MLEQKLLVLLESVLGESQKKTGNNYAFFSPFKDHYKKKLEIDITINADGENPWHCWISDAKGRSIRSLFKKLGVSESIWNQHNAIFKNIYKLHGAQILSGSYSNPQDTGQILQLPEEYKPLWEESSSIVRKHALMYLTKRGVRPNDIIKYSIGYCETGEYANKIIIPSYDTNGMLNYYVGRSFYDDNFKHKKAAVSNDIIGFELFINWDLPIIICEGVFDAIAIRNNAIPLFGKAIQHNLKLKILQKKVSDIYIALDPDAIETSLNICEDFMNDGVRVHLVYLKDGDPSYLGYDKITQLIRNSKQFTFEDLIEYKLMNV